MPVRGFPSSFMACEASTVPVLLVSAAPALNARMMRQAKNGLAPWKLPTPLS